jgi:hypothetical protein
MADDERLASWNDGPAAAAYQAAAHRFLHEGVTLPWAGPSTGAATCR